MNETVTRLDNLLPHTKAGCDVEQRSVCALKKGMTFIRGGMFTMGSDHHYPEEGPAHRVRVDDFWIDTGPVTNTDFKRFADETGYVTLAERAPDPRDYPGIRPEMMRAGSLVFTRPGKPIPLSDPFGWWRFQFGADWRHPEGTASSIEGRDHHPVVHIACEDAEAFARWSGKVLPTEAEWEYAARGGLEAAEFAWGDELEPDGRPAANYWQGNFPWENDLTDGYAGTSPTEAFPPNGYGLYDMIGNVWEWTADWFEPRHQQHDANKTPGSCCVPRNPRGGRRKLSFDPCAPQFEIGRRVLKGGSHLCAANYCQRYRPAARYPQPVDTATTHVGFRCAMRQSG